MSLRIQLCKLINSDPELDTFTPPRPRLKRFELCMANIIVLPEMEFALTPPAFMERTLSRKAGKSVSWERDMQLSLLYVRWLIEALAYRAPQKLLFMSKLELYIDSLHP